MLGSLYKEHKKTVLASYDLPNVRRVGYGCTSGEYPSGNFPDSTNRHKTTMTPQQKESCFMFLLCRTIES